MTNNWKARFMDLAFFVAQWSKDPSTKVGSVIVRPDKTIASTGYNGFPRGVEDLEERYNDRPTKLLYTVHGETNAILSAKEPLHGYSLFVTGCPCNECAKNIIQSGITTVVFPKDNYFSTSERWKDSVAATRTMFKEADVEVVEL